MCFLLHDRFKAIELNAVLYAVLNLGDSQGNLTRSLLNKL